MTSNDDAAVECGSCGETFTGSRCPGCGAQIYRIGIATEVDTAASLGARKHAYWGGNELQLVGIVYATVVGVCAVVIPLHTWWSRLLFAILSLAGLVAMGVWKEPVIAVARRYLAWRGPGRRLQ